MNNKELRLIVRPFYDAVLGYFPEPERSFYSLAYINFPNSSTVHTPLLISIGSQTWAWAIRIVNVENLDCRNVYRFRILVRN